MPEQLIKKQVTITAGTSTTVQIAIPTGRDVRLKGYGYTWFASNTYQLSTGNLSFPSRTDQEGSPSIPRIFDVPFPCWSGGLLQLTITNGDSSDHTYDVVFYLIVDSMLTGPSTNTTGGDYNSTGGELLINTASGSGSGGNVALYDSSFTNAAPVTTTYGLGVDPKPPAAIYSGTKALSTTGAALASTQAIKRGVLIQNPATNTINALVGNSGSQDVVLEPGREMFIEVADIATVYVKSASGTPTINYIAS